jgi:hypothetical protein
VILAPPETDRIFLHDAGANDTFAADDVDYELVSHVKLFHFGYPPLMARMYERDGDELVSLFSRVKAAGVTTSLDMAMPGTGSNPAASMKIAITLPAMNRSISPPDQKEFGLSAAQKVIYNRLHTSGCQMEKRPAGRPTLSAPSDGTGLQKRPHWRQASQQPPAKRVA